MMTNSPLLKPLPKAGEGANVRSLSLEESDLHLLPPSMQWLAKAIGLTAMLKLVKAHGGGTPIYVPMTVQLDHRLLYLIGVPAFTALVSEYGGDQIEIARCEKAARVLIYREIRREYAEGKSQNTLALKYDLTVRRIRDILNSQMEDDMQGGLF